MQFGICTTSGNAAAVKAAGWDYVEENAQGLLRGTTPDADWHPPADVPLPIPAVNSLVPGTLKIVGPAADPDGLRQYLTTVVARAARCGVDTMVFGSGVARMVPADVDLETAGKQIVDFARTAADLAAPHGITVVIEPLNRGECNIINSVAEAARFVKTVDRPNCQCLVDTFHLWHENEPLENVRRAVASIRHVHVADLDGRVAPGQSGKADYRPLFKILKLAGYDRRISFEGAPIPDFDATAPKVLAFLKGQWEEA